MKTGIERLDLMKPHGSGPASHARHQHHGRRKAIDSISQSQKAAGRLGLTLPRTTGSEEGSQRSQLATLVLAAEASGTPAPQEASG